MEFTLVDQDGHAVRVITCPHTVTFVLGTCNQSETANQGDAEISYQSASLLERISKMHPAHVCFFVAAMQGDTVVSIGRHVPEAGVWPVETIEIHVGAPGRDGASLCFPIRVFQALLIGAVALQAE